MTLPLPAALSYTWGHQAGTAILQAEASYWPQAASPPSVFFCLSYSCHMPDVQQVKEARGPDSGGARL